MTLNGVMAIILRFFITKLDSFEDPLHQSGWLDYRPILSAT